MEQTNCCFSQEGSAAVIEPAADPEIFFDDPPQQEKVLEGRKAFYGLPNAVFLLDSVQRLLEIVHSQKELRIVRLRLRGKSYREIASVLRIGIASVHRLIRRIRKDAPEVGFLLEHAQAWREDSRRMTESYSTEESPSRT